MDESCDGDSFGGKYKNERHASCVRNSS
jgi:hypothetical protein